MLFGGSVHNDWQSLSPLVFSPNPAFSHLSAKDTGFKCVKPQLGVNGWPEQSEKKIF